jgi:DUF4097 and DUF4098 domain-containing protein YvlB
MRLVPAVFAAALAAAPATQPLAAQASRQYRLGGNSVAVYNLVGSMQLEAGSGGDVQVEVRPAGADAAKLTVQQGEIAGRNTLRVVYPDDRITYRSRHWDGQTTLRVRDDGTFDDDERGERGERGRRVTIESRGEGLDASADLRILVPAGRTLAVHLAVGDVRATNVDGRITLSTSSADVTVTGSRGALDVDVGSGDVDVTDNRGDLDIDTGSGDVTLTGSAGGRLSIDTGSGDVIGTDVRATDLKVDTGSGSVKLSGGISGVVSLDTGSGDVSIALTRDLREVSIESGSGDVTLHMPEGIGADLDVETSSGDIETDFPVSITRHEEDHLRGTIGGGGARIRVDASSGAVRLLKS